MKLDPNSTAIILIEFQNDFTSEGGIFHDAVKAVMQSTNMLQNTLKVVEKSRESGIQILHVPISFAAGYRELTSSPYGILKGVVDAGAFKKDTWGSAIVDDLTPEKNDIIIEGKRGLDGFVSTNLDFILRSKKIENVVLAGFLTNCCVESTMRTAYEKGFNVITLTDCCGALSQEEHDNATEHDFTMFSQPMTHKEFLGLLSEQGEVVMSGKAYSE